MMISWNGRIALTLVASLVLSACGAGGAGGVAPTPATAAAKGKHHGKGRLVFRIKIPKKHHQRKRLAHGRDGKPHYISSATKGLTLSITGPQSFSLSETVSLLPTAQGCTSTLASTQCTLTVPGLQACPGSGNCYTASIETWDAVTGCPSACTIPDSANELSANETIPFNVAAAAANMISATLDGIPNNVVLVPSIDSSLFGSPYGGFTLSKCGSDQVNVFATDADGNYILGAGAPVPSLQSDTPKLIVATPAPETPNTFTISRSNANLPAAGSIANLTAVMTPLANSQADAASNQFQLTFDSSICGVITLFSIPTANTTPEGIALGSDGNVWFTENTGNAVGRVTTTGVVTEFTSGLTASAHSSGIAQGPDGNMWFTEISAGKVGTIDTGGAITEYAVGSVSPTGITAGPDGNLWFTEAVAGSKIGQMDTGGNLANEFTTTMNSTPNAITTGPDSNLWFTQASGSVGQMTTDGTVAEFSVPTASSAPTGIAAGPDGNLWIVEHAGNKVSLVTTSGAFTEYLIVGGGAPRGIVAGADGNMYFTLQNGHMIGQISTDGNATMAEFSTGLTSANAPYAITLGADNNLWFTDSAGGKIGRLQ
ncbi:MAG TPA: hypothetical protein VK760_09840 [Candidatus Acidoferrales bacterium]|nr:hypothetical protein [Candidatus Acidoferrales bacterium]